MNHNLPEQKTNKAKIWTTPTVFSWTPRRNEDETKSVVLKPLWGSTAFDRLSVYELA